jgi:hypothetical protein
MFLHSSNRRLIKLSLAFLIIGFVLQPLFADPNSNDKERNQIPEKYKWNLKDLYATHDEW